VRYVIEHETSLTFPSAVREHQTELRLTPRQDEAQRIHAVQIETDPPAELFTYVDCFGNRVHYFSLMAPHDRLLTRLHAEVETLLDNPFDYPSLHPSQEHAWFAEQLRTQPRLRWGVNLSFPLIPTFPRQGGRGISIEACQRQSHAHHP
jgi:transglutaminase-like putative cysteine protease